MSLLLPAGLLGLIGLIILLIIYLIRPNYQTKYISTTFVWKLSMKYRKKKLPTSKLRNILLIICQVLIITIASMILAKPVHEYLTQQGTEEAVCIIDAGASMRTETEGETRYERAVEKVRALSETVFEKNGVVSVIQAERTASFLCERVTAENKADLNDTLNSLVDGTLACTYSTSDVDAAIDLCEDILRDNEAAKVYLYTDTTYSYVPSNVTVVNVSEEGEWNAAILNAYTEFNDNYYDIIVEVACYGRDYQLGVNVFVEGANAESKYDGGSTAQTIQLQGQNYQVDCMSNETVKIVFKATNFEDMSDVSDNEVMFDISDNRFYSYDHIMVYLDEYDDYELDNEFDIYGGMKETIKIQYSTTLANPFVTGILSTLQNQYAGSYEITYVEHDANKSDAELEGYNYYIFEHYVPSTLPTDGVVLILDPYTTSIPSSAGFKVETVINYNKTNMPITPEVDETDPLNQGIDWDDVTVTQLDKITYYDPAYTVLASVDNNPVLLYRNDGATKIFVMAYSVHYSNMPLKLAFPYLFNNIFQYYTPLTVSANSYEVYDTVTMNSRSEKVTISYNGETLGEFTSFPAEFQVTTAGTYEIDQTTYFDEYLTDKIYVRSPRAESNICEVKDALAEPYKQETEKQTYTDLLFWFALALVCFTALEWFLKNRDNA